MAQEEQKTLHKSAHFWVLNIVGNICDNVGTQLNKIHNKGLVIFRHSFVEMVYLSANVFKYDKQNVRFQW